jgi:hypothetical protein
LAALMAISRASGHVVLDQVADDGDSPLPGGGDRRQHVALADQAVRHQALRQALQGLAERGGGAGEVVHGKGMGGLFLATATRSLS